MGSGFKPLLIAQFLGGPLWACGQCRPLVSARIYDSDFPKTLALMLIPSAALILISVVAHFALSSGPRPRGE
jgi:hypothetical protein